MVMRRSFNLNEIMSFFVKETERKCHAKFHMDITIRGKVLIE